MLITLVQLVFLTSTCISWPDTLNACYLRFLVCLSYCWGIQKVQLLYELWNVTFWNETLYVTELLSQHYLCESKISQKAFIAQLCYGHYLCHFAQVSCSWHFFGVGIILRVLKALDNSYWVHFVRKSPVKVVYRHFWYIHFDCKINFNSSNSHLF